MINTNSEIIENALNEYLKINDKNYDVLFQSMRYSALNGGKRIRPFLTLEFCKLFGGKVEVAIPFACAVEFVHTYSLIHDDLPCMDNDDLRRGKLTNHKVYGEATALLAGDALLTYAFDIISVNKYTSPTITLKAVQALAKSAGMIGMIGGQMLDLIGEKQRLDYDTLKHLHSMKTGEMIKVACILGCYASEKDSSENLNACIEYAQNIGLAFQIIDDILDVTGDVEVLGKPIGSDDVNKKTTFMTHMTTEDAFKYASELTLNAHRAIEKFKGSETLCELADYLLLRTK